LIRLEDVTVNRGGSEVLRRASLQIPSGRLTAIVGPSGAGKTTLISVLNGLIAPREGSVTASDVGRLDNAEAIRLHRSRTATIFQDHALVERLTALENVLLGFADLRHPISILPWPLEMRRRAAEALASVGLLRLAHTRVARLSGGERQRVGVARAFVRNPSLLLGDEPFSSIDPTLVLEMGRTLRRAVSAGTTVVVVLHQLEVALPLADWVIGLAEGRPVFAGPVETFDEAARRKIFDRPKRRSIANSQQEEIASCLASHALSS